jgi:hypothetical protein
MLLVDKLGLSAVLLCCIILQDPMPNYWIVGANVDGQDMTDSFVKYGFWFADAVGAQKVIENIQVGDRLAIKRMIGPSAPSEVLLRAVGVVRESAKYEALDFRMLHVNWIRIDDRRIPNQGFMGALHGPYTTEEAKNLKGDIFFV